MVDVYGRNTGYQTKKLRQRCSYIAVFVSIPWSTTCTFNKGISFVTHTHDGRETFASQNTFFIIKFPSFERLDEVNDGLL